MNGGPEIQVLSPAECRQLLATTRHGRLGLSMGALPAIRSVVFALTPGHLVFRVAPRSQLRQATRNSVVAFQADHSGEGDGIGWCVVVQGLCQEVTAPRLVHHLRDLPLPAWSADHTADVFLRLPLERIRGERVLW